MDSIVYYMYPVPLISTVVLICNDVADFFGFVAQRIRDKEVENAKIIPTRVLEQILKCANRAWTMSVAAKTSLNLQLETTFSVCLYLLGFFKCAR